MFAACGVEEESKIGRVAVVEMLRLNLCFLAESDMNDLCPLELSLRM